MEFNAAKEPAWFPESKIYFNGSQHIAIPHTTRRYKKRPTQGRISNFLYIRLLDKADDCRIDIQAYPFYLSSTSLHSLFLPPINQFF